MPTLFEADSFVNNSQTSIMQLRIACQILGLDDSGSLEELRARLNQHLAGAQPEAPVVCLNPEPAGPDHKVRASETQTEDHP